MTVHPYRRRQLAFILVLIAGSTCLQVIGDVLSWGPVRWTVISAYSREVMLLTGPIAMACGAWVAHAWHTAAVSPVPGLPTDQIIRRHLTLLAGAVVAGYLLGLSPTWATGIARASAGHLDGLAVLAGTSSLFMLVVIGYCVGYSLRAPVSMAVSTLTGLGITGGLVLISDVLTSNGAPFSLFSIAPFWTISAGRGWTEPPQTSLFRVLFFLTVAAALIGWLAYRARRNLPDRHSSIRRGLGLAAAPVTLAIAAVLTQPDVVRPLADPPITCTPEEEVRLCMYTEERVLLAPSQTVIATGVARFGRGAFSGTATSLRPPHHRTPMNPGDLVFVPQVEYGEQNFTASLSGDLARAISGAAVCSEDLYRTFGPDYPDLAPRSRLESDVISRMVAAELAARLGGLGEEGLSLPGDEDGRASQGLLNTLASWSDAAVKSWLEAHAGDLRACQVSPEDVTT